MIASFPTLLLAKVIPKADLKKFGIYVLEKDCYAQSQTVPVQFS